MPLQDPARIRELIVALMYLHNFCENQKDGWVPDDEDDDDDDDEDEAPEPRADADAEAAAGRARRQEIVDYLAAMQP